MFKFESTAGVGDRVRAYDFRGMDDAYIEGVVTAKGAVHTPSGMYVYEGYTIAIDVDTLGGQRVGDVGYVAFETSLDYDGRVVLCVREAA